MLPFCAAALDGALWDCEGSELQGQWVSGGHPDPTGSHSFVRASLLQGPLVSDKSHIEPVWFVAGFRVAWGQGAAGAAGMGWRIEGGSGWQFLDVITVCASASDGDSRDSGTPVSPPYKINLSESWSHGVSQSWQGSPCCPHLLS